MPERRQRVQTFSLRTPPFTMARTVCRLGSNRRGRVSFNVRGEADREELAAKNAKRRSDAEPGHADVRSRAERVWKKNPELSASAVAKIIESECPGYVLGTIRKLIRQK